MFVAGSVFLACLVAFASANPLALLGGSCSDPFEEYSNCGSPCTPTCGNPKPICESQCVQGCFCREGYVRGPEGHCIIHTGCGGYRRHHHHHRKCGANERLKRCKRACEPTCKHRRPHDCSEECVDYGCQCKSGFVRDRHDDCIPYDLCPGKNRHCGKNEYYSNDTNVPERKCQEPRCPNQKFPSNCPRYTTNGGCVCKDTYVRNKRGKCVKPDECERSSHHSSDRSSYDSRTRSRSDSWEDSDSDSDSWDKSRRRRHRHRHRNWSSDRSSRHRHSSEWRYDDCDCNRSYRKRNHCFSFCDSRSDEYRHHHHHRRHGCRGSHC